MLTLYRRALHLRRAEFPPDAPMSWLSSFSGVPVPAGVLAFTRGQVACITNLSPSPVELPAGDIILTSTPLDGTALTGDSLPSDATAWIRLPVTS